MKRKSEFLNNKKVDYFGLMEKHNSEMKLRFNEELKNETFVTKRVPQAIVETPSMIARKAEINAAKATLYLLSTTDSLQLIQTKSTIAMDEELKRRSELINCKRVLEAAVSLRAY